LASISTAAFFLKGEAQVKLSLTAVVGLSLERIKRMLVSVLRGECDSEHLHIFHHDMARRYLYLGDTSGGATKHRRANRPGATRIAIPGASGAAILTHAHISVAEIL